MANELLADVLRRNLGMLQMTLADFTDADLLVRPVPGANHAAWQLGHLFLSEARLIGMFGGQPPEPPAGFAERFAQDKTNVDDPKQLATKDEIMAYGAKVREASAKWVLGLTPQDMEKPGPPRMASIAPTVGHLAQLIAGHATMHMGQIQVIRRKLGKPVLF